MIDFGIVQRRLTKTNISEAAEAMFLMINLKVYRKSAPLFVIEYNWAANLKMVL